MNPATLARRTIERLEGTRVAALVRRFLPGGAITLSPAQAGIVLAVVVVLAATAVAVGRAPNSATPVVAPVVTPQAHELPPTSHDVPSLPPTPAPTPTTTLASAAVSGASPGATSRPTATLAPTPTPRPAPFSMDLYQKGDFVGEYVDTWCVPAAMQTSINIMSAGADTSRGFQTKLYNLASSLEPGNTGGADALGWPEALAKLGYGNYELDVRGSINAAAWTVARAIRLTNRPAGLIVWYGWHSWVVSGFKATADPALTNAFTVTGLYIEDVWYNRLSSIWGYSNPPDTFVKTSDLSIDYKPYHEWTKDPTRDGKFVFVLPVD